MACLVRIGILAVASIAWAAWSDVFAAAPAWENGGRAYEASDLPSVVVDGEPTLADGQPPLPPEPGAPEELGLPALADEGEGAEAITDQAPSLGEQLQEFVPSPDVMTFDSAVAIEPDGTVVPCSTKRGVWDCLTCWEDACWVARFEAIALWRNAPANRPLFTTIDQGTQTIGPTVFSANQLNSDPLAAPRLTIARLDECGRGFDASYLYAGNFYSQRSLPPVPDGYAFASPGIYGNSSGLDGATINAAQQQLTASLQSAEINYRQPLGWGSTRFLTGFRWLQWRENWSMVDQLTTGSESWETDCLNNLYGGQLGLDSMLWNSGKGMRLEGLVKAGAYYNAANQSSRYSNAAAPITINGPAGSAFIGEVGLTGIVPLRKNLDLRCGYFGLWLQGLAQPTRQLSGQTLTQNAPPSGMLTTNGGVVLQGVSLGLEGRW
jgi:hypothetical protein